MTRNASVVAYIQNALDMKAIFFILNTTAKGRSRLEICVSPTCNAIAHIVIICMVLHAACANVLAPWERRVAMFWTSVPKGVVAKEPVSFRANDWVKNV